MLHDVEVQYARDPIRDFVVLLVAASHIQAWEAPGNALNSCPGGRTLSGRWACSSSTTSRAGAAGGRIRPH